MADYLILHRNLQREVKQYWQFVYGDDEEKIWDPGVRAYMMRHKKYGRRLEQPTPKLLSKLRKQLGQPVYEDSFILVWEL